MGARDYRALCWAAAVSVLRCVLIGPRPGVDGRASTRPTSRSTGATARSGGGLGPRLDGRTEDGRAAAAFESGGGDPLSGARVLQGAGGAGGEDVAGVVV
eukprot:6911142-Pyramimonas_sp.AAC.1